jgi:molecular chaperone DnaK
MNEAGSKLAASETEPVKSAIADAKKVLENKTASSTELKSALESLQTVAHKMTEAAYKAGAAQPGADAGAAGAAGGAEAKKDGDDVIDADFKDVN